MKKRCWFHDYQIVEQYQSDYFSSPFQPCGITATKKVCIKCGKVIDDVTALKQRDIQHQESQTKRIELAKEFLKNDKK